MRCASRRSPGVWTRVLRMLRSQLAGCERVCHPIGGHDRRYVLHPSNCKLSCNGQELRSSMSALAFWVTSAPKSSHSSRTLAVAAAAVMSQVLREVGRYACTLQLAPSEERPMPERGLPSCKKESLEPAAIWVPPAGLQGGLVAWEAWTWCQRWRRSSWALAGCSLAGQRCLRDPRIPY